MATKFEKITYLGRNNPSLTLQDHVLEMRETREISRKLKNEWYKEGLTKFNRNATYVQEYYAGKDYWKSDITNDELLSIIQTAGGHSRLLKIAGRRLAEVLDELESRPGRS